MEGTQLFEMALGLSGGWKAVRSEFSVVQFSDSPGSAIRRERRSFSPRRLILAKRHFLCSVGSGCFADSDMFL